MGMVYTILRKGSGAVIAAWAHDCGDIAQLVERCVRNAEVRGSSPLISTKSDHLNRCITEKPR